MNQPNQANSSAVPVPILPAKRRRGRPRKDESRPYVERPSVRPAVDLVKGNQPQSADVTAPSDNALVGQVVSGVLDGSFDSGYLLTVKVGNTNTVLRGVVFEPARSIPISVANDVAPNVKMSRRSEIPLPVVTPINQVPFRASTYEAKNEEPIKPSTLASIPPESSLGDKSCPPKGPANDSNHDSQAAIQVKQPSTKAESSAIIHMDGQPDCIHQTLPIASQASTSNIEQGKSTEVVFDKTNLAPKGAEVNSRNQFLPTIAPEKSDLAIQTLKSSDNFNHSLPIFAHTPHLEPNNGTPVLVVQESKASTQPTMSNGMTAASDTKLEQNSKQSLETLGRDASGKEAQVAFNQASQMQVHPLGSTLDANPFLDVQNLSDLTGPPLPKPVEFVGGFGFMDSKDAESHLHMNKLN